MRKITGLCFLCTAFLFFGCEPPKAVIPAVLPEVEGIKLRDLPYNPSQVVIAEVKALDEVNLVARVEGFLRKRFFKEGSRVKKGELLFEIEPELYQAKVKAAQAKLTRARVAQKNADTDYKRQRQLLDEVWGFDSFGDSRTVDVHIKRLREKLEGVSEKWSLKTVWGVGYKFEVL